MSSRDNSNRANSGNAFERDFLSSSTPEGRQTPNFSWTDSSRRELTSHHDNDAEGSSKPSGGQDEAEVTSSSQVEVSCAYDISTITIQNAYRLAEHYGLEVHMPSKLCRVH